MSRGFFIRTLQSISFVISLVEPRNDTSVAKTVFLAWLLREVCSFRDSEYYGQFTQKSSDAMRQSKVLRRKSVSRPPRLIPVLSLLMNLLFFGIPHTYYAHVKVFVSVFLVLSSRDAGLIGIK